MSFFDDVGSWLGGTPQSLSSPNPTPYAPVNRIGLIGAALADAGASLQGRSGGALDRMRQMAEQNALYNQQNTGYQRALSALTAPSQPNAVSVTPQVTPTAGGGTSFNPANPAYSAPAMSTAGPLNGSPVADLLKSVPANEGMPQLMSMLGPHKLDYQTDGSGVIHAFDSLTGKEVGGTYGAGKPIDVGPGHTLVAPDSAGGGTAASTTPTPGFVPSPQPNLPRIGQAAPTPATGSIAGQNITNNNPGNLRVPGGTGFQKFPDMQTGINAVGNQIGRYIARGNNTITGIVSTYAPASDNNNTKAYIAAVAQKTGIDPTKPITPDQIPAVRDAMISVEQGGVSPSQLLAGGGQPPQASAQPIQAPQAQPAAAPTGYHGVYTAPPPSEIPLTAAELSQYHALPGSTRNSATGAVTRATPGNSMPDYSPQQLQSMAVEMLQNGGKPLQGRDPETNRLINDTMSKPVSQGGLRPDNMSPQEWGSLVTNAGIGTNGRKQAAALLAKQNAATAVNEGTVNNSIKILTNLIPRAASTGPVTSINGILQSFRRGTNDPDAINFKNAIDSITNEYARVLTGSTTGAPSSDAARADAANRILAGYNAHSLPAVLAQMQAEMRGRSQAQVEGLQALSGGQFGGIPVSGSKPLPPQPQNLPRKAGAPIKVGRFTVQQVGP